MRVIHRPSPNHNPRPAGRGPVLVVMHGTASRDNAVAWLCDPSSKLSAHYVIDRDGTIYQLVAESQRAWHAGVSHWMGRDSVNDFSIGIEMANKGPDRRLYRPGEAYPEPWPEAIYASAATLVADILKRRGLPLSQVVRHEDIAPGRKSDPWSFDWDRFRRDVVLLLHPDPDPQVATPAPDAPPLDLAA